MVSTMIEWSAIKQYRKFAFEDECLYSEGSGTLIIVHGGKKYSCPMSETTETFLDRIKRSQTRNKNLFYEEWNLIED